MQHILVLKFAAPLQSWGVSGRFDERTTQPYPSKSATVGLLASALGITREETEAIAQLSRQLEVGVRVERQGSLLRDYHVVDIGKGKKLSNRYYIEDGIFLVAVASSDETLIQSLATAVKNPRFAPFLGRKSCPPGEPLFQEVVEAESLASFLLRHPSLLKEHNLTRLQKQSPTLTALAVWSSADGTVTRQDEPLSLSRRNRTYGSRTLKEEYVEAPNPHFIQQEVDLTFDPFAILQEPSA